MTQENENIDATDRSAAPGGGNSDGEQRKDVERIADSQGASGEAADSAYDPDITATIPVVRPKGAKGSKKKASKGGKGSKAAARGSSKARGAALSASTTLGKGVAKADAASREAAKRPGGGDDGAAKAEAASTSEGAAKATAAVKALAAAESEVEAKPTAANKPESSQPAAAAKSPFAAEGEDAAKPDSGGKRPVEPDPSVSAASAAAADGNDAGSRENRAVEREEPVAPAQKAFDAAEVAAAAPAATPVQAGAHAPQAGKAGKAESASARVADATDVASKVASTSAKAGESHVPAPKAGNALKAGDSPKAGDDASKAGGDVAPAGKDDAAAAKGTASRAADAARPEDVRQNAVSDRASARSAVSAASAPKAGGSASAQPPFSSAQPLSSSAGPSEKAKSASSAAGQDHAQGSVPAAGFSAAPAAGGVANQSANASLTDGLAARVGKEGARQEASGESRPAVESPRPEAPSGLDSHVGEEPSVGEESSVGEEPHIGKVSDVGPDFDADKETDAGAVASGESETSSVSDLSDDDTATIPAVERSIAAQPVVYGPGAEAWQQRRQPPAGETDDGTPKTGPQAAVRADTQAAETSQAAEIEHSRIHEADSPAAGAPGSYWDTVDDAAATTAHPAVQSTPSAVSPPYTGAAESEPAAGEFASRASAAETAAGKETARDSASSLGAVGPADSVAESRHGLADSEAAVAEPGRSVAEPDEAAVVESAQGVAQPEAALAEPVQGVAQPEVDADLEPGVAGPKPDVAEPTPAADFSSSESRRDLTEPPVQAQPPAQAEPPAQEASPQADASAPAETPTSRPTVSAAATSIRGSEPEASSPSVDGGLSSLETSAERTAEKLGKDEVSDGEPAKRRRVWLWVAAAALVFGLVYVGAAFYFSNKIPASTTVAGVKVGGMSREAAQAKLESELSGRLSQPVKVSIGGKEQTIDPSSIGAKFDAKSTVDSLSGFSLNPLRLWDSMTGGSEVSPTVDVDQAKLRKTVDSLVDASVNTPTNASIEFDGVTPKTTKAKKGVDLNREEASKKIAEKMLDGKTIPLPVNEKEPDIKDSEAQRALKDLAKPLVSGNLTVKVGSATVTVTPKQLVSVAKFVASDGELKLKLDSEKLSDVVRKGAPTLLKEGKDAKIEIVDHTTPKIIPSEDGVGFDEGKLAESAAEAATTGDRKVEIATKSVPAKFTTEDAEKMGVKEVVSSIETPLTNDAVRTTNLKVGTQKVANTLVKPDEEFSLLKALGPIDAAHGFVSSGVVANGFNSTALGGGLSQLSTNTFNLGYRAGFVDVEHKPHSKYFSRYPMGMESTLWEGRYDMRFKNNTPYGAVIDTWVADGKVYSKLWSTKYWDVETTTSKPYAQVAPTTKVNPARDCEPSGAGGPGFTVTVSRKVSRDGKVHENSSYKWTYSPTNRVVCK